MYWFYQHHDTPHSFWVRVFSPVFAGVGLSILFVGVWQNYSTLLGEQTPSMAARLLPFTPVALVVAGLLRAGWLYALRRPTYRNIGHHDSDTLTAPLHSQERLDSDRPLDSDGNQPRGRVQGIHYTTGRGV